MGDNGWKRCHLVSLWMPRKHWPEHQPSLLVHCPDCMNCLILSCRGGVLVGLPAAVWRPLWTLLPRRGHRANPTTLMERLAKAWFLEKSYRAQFSRFLGKTVGGEQLTSGACESGARIQSHPRNSLHRVGQTLPECT